MEKIEKIHQKARKEQLEGQIENTNVEVSPNLIEIRAKIKPTFLRDRDTVISFNF